MSELTPRRCGVSVLRVLVAAVFLYAGLTKVREPEELRVAIVGYRMIPPAWAMNLAFGLPFFEAIAGFWLLLGWRPRVPALGLLMLSIIFSLALAQALMRGLNIDCGCFAGASGAAGHLRMPLLRDGLLVTALVILYRWYHVMQRAAPPVC